MRAKNWKRSVGLFLYDRQPGGKRFAAARKSFQEVYRALQGEGKKGA